MLTYSEFNIFQILHVFRLPASLPAVRPTSARSMALEISQNKDNCVRFTKLLFRLRFFHCAMVIPLMAR